MSTPGYVAPRASHVVPAERTDSLTDLSARRIAALVAAHEVSVVEVVQAHLARVVEAEPGIRALVRSARC